jgi:DNA recombination protein RmuC
MSNNLYIFYFFIGALASFGVLLLGYLLLPKLLKRAREDLWKEKEKMDSSLASSVSELRKDITSMLAKHQSDWESTAEVVRELNTSYVRWETALSNPSIQGKLAEIGLEEMLQSAGLMKEVNYLVQPVQAGRGKPDIIVLLPDNASIIIDAKAPWNLYQQFVEAEEGEKEQKRQLFAEGMIDHVDALHIRNYPAQSDRQTPELVLMFLPSISMYLDAIGAINDLTEQALIKKISICPPEILYSQLKNIALTWQQKTTYENVVHIQKLAKELHGKVRVFNNHLFKMGNSLKSTVEHYNQAGASYRENLAVTLEKFEDENLIPRDDRIKAQKGTKGSPEYPKKLKQNLKLMNEE